jgi:uncharacterized protein (TIGR02271 family)
MMQEREGEQPHPGDERVIDLREEQLLADKKLEQMGEIVVRKVVDQRPAELQVDALREELEVVHEAVGQSVSERQAPYEEDGVLVVPVYEEQLVVTKRLMLRERLRVRRISTTEHQVIQDTVKRERLVVEDPQGTGRVHEIHPEDKQGESEEDPGFLTRLVTKALE